MYPRTPRRAWTISIRRKGYALKPLVGVDRGLLRRHPTHGRMRPKERQRQGLVLPYTVRCLRGRLSPAMLCLGRASQEGDWLPYAALSGKTDDCRIRLESLSAGSPAKTNQGGS